MIRALEFIGITGGVIAIIAIVVVVGGAMLYMQLTKDGRNPFQ